ncbi:MAG: hypothetical protein ACK4MW_04485 [Aquificaceae bacterium]
MCVHSGIVKLKTAEKLGLTGIVGRACGIKYDVRYSFPYESYKDIKKDIHIESLGGVFERYKLKTEEIRDSINFIEMLTNKIDKVKRHRPELALPTDKEALVSVETVKGELIVYGKTAKDSKRFDRVYFRTPSFINWEGLAYAVLGEIVPDFPLCNKSFNMSYSENDR